MFLQEVQHTHLAEVLLHHTSLMVTKPMEEIARKNKEIEQLRMQLNAKVEESERKIQDLEAENQALKQQLSQEGKQLQQEIEHRREESLVGTEGNVPGVEEVLPVLMEEMLKAVEATPIAVNLHREKTHAQMEYYSMNHHLFLNAGGLCICIIPPNSSSISTDQKRPGCFC